MANVRNGWDKLANKARLALIGISFFLAVGSTAASASTQDTHDELSQWLTTASSAPGTEPGSSPLLPISPTAAGVARSNDLSFIKDAPVVLKLDETNGIATILANGRVEVGNSGDETSITLLDPGLFRLRRQNGHWQVDAALPLGRNQISAHRLAVVLRPESGLVVTDVMDVVVVGDDGFAVGLNRRAEIREVQIDGVAARSAFRNGLLWLDARAGPRTILLSYEVTVERESGANSGAFLNDHGHVRNQYWWHPHLGLTEAGSRAAFDVTVTAPIDVRVALDLPQSETTADGIRTIRVESSNNVNALSLAYDTRWTPRTLTSGDFTLELFAAPDFAPDEAALLNAFASVTGSLSDRFGVPSQRDVAVVQNRARNRPAWAFLSNSAIHAGPAGAAFDQPEEFPVHAPFGHEVAHLWTQAGGELQYMLTEGWATYAEAVILEASHGSAAADRFWRDRARLLALQPELLDTPLDRDASNGGVSYHKGAWVFAMLERVLGRETFDAGIRRFANAASNERNYAGFLKSFGQSTPIARRFLATWISAPSLPRLTISREGDRLFLEQIGPQYWLPGLEVLVEPENGEPSTVRVDVNSIRTALPVAAQGAARITIDPRSRYLLLSDRTISIR